MDSINRTGSFGGINPYLPPAGSQPKQVEAPAVSGGDEFVRSRQGDADSKNLQDAARGSFVNLKGKDFTTTASTGKAALTIAGDMSLNPTQAKVELNKMIQGDYSSFSLNGPLSGKITTLSGEVIAETPKPTNPTNLLME